MSREREILRRKERNRKGFQPEGRRASKTSRKMKVPQLSSSFAGEEKTSFGARLPVFRGPYEVFFETMGPGTNSGVVCSEDGCLSLIVQVGTLFVNKELEQITYEEIEGEETRVCRIIKESTKVEVGEIVSFEAGSVYSYGTGNGSVTFVRIHTEEYAFDISSPEIGTVDDIGVQSIIGSQSRTSRSTVASHSKPTKRRSIDAQYRNKVTSHQLRDNQLRTSGKESKRIRRRSKSAAEVLPLEGSTFVDPNVDIADPNAYIPATNPRVVSQP